jgi:hypothetical protein
MHSWQPMQASWSMSTTPSSSRYDAPVGHTSTQGAFSHCWHCFESHQVLTLGHSP